MGRNAAIVEAVHAGLAAARRSHPGLGVSAEGFVDHVCRLLEVQADPVAALAELRFADLYLCWACARGDGAALGRFEQDGLGQARAALARLGLTPDERAEILQELRAELLVGESPRILRFGGRGSLGGFVKVIATRLALRRRRRREAARPSPDAGAVEGLADGPDDPERAPMKRRYQGALEEALGAAFEALAPADRTLLRLYALDGLTLAELGKLDGVDASTVSRRLARIRAGLLDEARRRLGERLRLSPDEYDTLVGILKSGLHVSVARLLRER
jgi:RNA polymerase sigma-70 factor (ECF subfamily)